jgi:hypothetical protein
MTAVQGVGLADETSPDLHCTATSNSARERTVSGAVLQRQGRSKHSTHRRGRKAEWQNRSRAQDKQRNSLVVDVQHFKRRAQVRGVELSGERTTSSLTATASTVMRDSRRVAHEQRTHANSNNRPRRTGTHPARSTDRAHSRDDRQVRAG